jgi:hypothetical protein
MNPTSHRLYIPNHNRSSTQKVHEAMILSCYNHVDRRLFSTLNRKEAVNTENRAQTIKHTTPEEAVTTGDRACTNTTTEPIQNGNHSQEAHTRTQKRKIVIV